MGRSQDFGATGDVAITVLVDNRADQLVRSTTAVKHYMDQPLLAEHGFAALVDLKAAGVRLLWDAGTTRVALLENLRRMEIDPATITGIALSHGHGDHIAAMTDVLQAMNPSVEPRKWEAGATPEEMLHWAEGRRVPLVAHPAAFRERWHLARDGTKYGPIPAPPRMQWEAAGAKVVLSEGPYRLGPGCWTTGTIPRRSFETIGRPADLAYREGDAFLHDDMEDDQAIIINVEGKGLVVLSGCAHSGIVNTVDYAREISGVERVWAILGGFHLGMAGDAEIRQTIDEVTGYRATLVAPTHCTGFRAMSLFAARMPDQFVYGVVGTTYLF